MSFNVSSIPQTKQSEFEKHSIPFIDSDDFAQLTKYACFAMEEIHLKVEMTCEGCVAAVKRVLTAKSEVSEVDVDLKEQCVRVVSTLTPDEVLQIVSKTGKKAELLKVP